MLFKGHACVIKNNISTAPDFFLWQGQFTQSGKDSWGQEILQVINVLGTGDCSV